MRQELKNLRRDNQRLTEANSTLERRVAVGRGNASSDQLWRYKEEVRWVALSTDTVFTLFPPFGWRLFQKMEGGKGWEPRLTSSGAARS